MTDTMGTRDKIRDFIRRHAADDVRDDQDIFESGLVSSMFVMQLVLFVEREFGISVSGSDLDFDYFRTVETVDELVTRKMSA